MKIFVGYGYNTRDAWIERDVVPILKAMGMEVVDGKDLHGEILHQAVQDRIDQSDALIGFSTLREGQEQAAFSSHIWVRDELQHAIALKKPVVEVREDGVDVPAGMLGDRQTIKLDQGNRLRCMAELALVVTGWSMRRLLLVPLDVDQARKINKALINGELTVRYRSRIGIKDSKYRDGRIDRVNKGLYLNAVGLPDNSLVEVEGFTTGGGVLFNTGWVSADVVRIEF